MDVKQPRRLCRRTAQEKQRLIERWKSSGLTIQVFCKQQGIAPSNFYHWRKRYDADNDGGQHGNESSLPRR